MANEMTVIDDATLESVLISGDLSKLTSPQRVQYYKRVCESLGLNPFTKPFEYITLNNKLTLYAKKDATDQLRSIQGVSIDDVDILETATQFIVKVKGHNRDNRQDVEVGVVNKGDMNGNLANAQMKAVTKGKRRLTLSLCGLGWLDETEIETIPSAKPVNVIQETGEIVDSIPMTIDEACKVVNREGVKYGELPTEKLTFMLNAVSKKRDLSDDQLEKVMAMQMILKARSDGSLPEPISLVETATELGGEVK
jgi:hypothetical protein